MSEDFVIACMDLVGRAGACEFEIGWTCPHVPGESEDHDCSDVTWHASARYRGARVTTEQHRSPSTAALALSERLLRGATCRCHKPVTLVDTRTESCRWRLIGAAWQPGCDVPSIRIEEGTRGDLGAMRHALVQAPTNRAERRRRAQNRKSSNG